MLTGEMGLYLVKTLKYFGEFIFGDANSIISNADLDKSRQRFQCNRDMTVRIGKNQCIFYQIA